MKRILNTQFLIIVSATTALFIGLFLLVAKPRFLALIKTYKEGLKAEETLSELSLKKQKLKELSLFSSRIENALKKAQLSLPSKKETSEFLVQLEKMAFSTSNTLKTVDIKEIPEEVEGGEGETEKEKITLFPISFSVNLSGSYKNLLDYLKNLETASRFQNILDISMRPTTEEVLETALSGQIYYQEESK